MGALTQLASFGAQDAYLTGNPQVTFFKSIYRRYTNFAMESIQQTFDGTSDFGKYPTVKISKNGDLVGPIWIEVTLPDLLDYNITPTPAEGNTSNVASLTTVAAANVYADTSGNYWQSYNGVTYANAIAVVDSATGNYYKYYTTLGNAATYTSNITTWPYMLITSNVSFAGRNNYDVPTANLRYVNGIGLSVIKSVELELGGQRIDKHYSEWWDVFTELTETAEKLDGYNTMVGRYNANVYTAGWTREQSKSRTFYVPMKFCYNRNPGMYMPLVALSYHDLKLNFEVRNYLECIKCNYSVSSLTSKTGSNPLSLTSMNLYADYVFLDAPERIRMSEMSHEYLVTQLQYQGSEPVPSPSSPNGTVNRKYNLNFNHPVRELIFVYQASSNYNVDAVSGNNIFNYEIPSTGGEVFTSATLIINGSNRFSTRSGAYFRLVQPYEHHVRVPSKSVYVYSFALDDADSKQPNGTANFTRYDSAQLQLVLNSNLPAGKIMIFATNFNILRIAAGINFSCAEQRAATESSENTLSWTNSVISRQVAAAA